MIVGEPLCFSGEGIAQHLPLLAIFTSHPIELFLEKQKSSSAPLPFAGYLLSDPSHRGLANGTDPVSGLKRYLFLRCPDTPNEPR